MRYFVAPKDATPEYVDAVTALRKITPDMATRAFAEATGEQREEAWASRYRLRRSGGNCCVARLLGKRCRQYERYEKGQEHPCQPPGSDHARLWSRDGKPAAFTFQPYGLSHDTLKDLLTYCERWGLRVTIDAWPAGHFPGNVLWVELTLGDRPLKAQAEEAQAGEQQP